MDFFSIPIIATAISIVISWAMFAILCSMIHETISQLKGERGRFMKKWLLKQLFDHPNGLNWASMLYTHGSVDLLTRKTSQPTAHIESKLFAETLIEVVGNAQAVQMHKELIKEPDPANPANTVYPFRSELLNNFKAATLVLKPSDVVSFYQKAMRSAELCTRPDKTPDEAEVYRCLVAQIEAWYKEIEARLSNWYKKRTRARLFWLGFLLALIFNVDSVQLFMHFNKSQSSRRVVMSFYEANADRLNKIAAETGDPIQLDSMQKKIMSYTSLMDSVSNAAAVPVGWGHSILNKASWPAQQRLLTGSSDKDIHSKLNAWDLLKLLLLMKIPGLLISGMAASFGAPFWFDLLKKVYSQKTKTGS